MPIRDRIDGQREAARRKLGSESGPTVIDRLRGRLSVLVERAQAIDPEHRRFGEED